jgi:DNA-directed RNA polymerase subunit alpha
MARLLSSPIILPHRVEVLEETPFLGKYVFRPLEAGYGVTVGNALRRVLLSSIEGYAIATLRIPGVLHEFSTIPGVVEDVVDVVLNLKQVALRPKHEKAESRLFIEIKGQEVFTAGALAKQASDYEVANPDLIIMHLDPSAKVQMELKVAKGRGYHLAEENKQILRDTLEPHEIVLDTSFSPVVRVLPRVETMLYEGRADYEQLILDIETKGTIAPRAALEEATRILMEHFERLLAKPVAAAPTSDLDQKILAFLSKPIDESPVASVLDAATAKAFYAKGIYRVIDLVSRSAKELESYYPRMGKKTIEDIQRILSGYGLKLGADVSAYRRAIPSEKVL